MNKFSDYFEKVSTKVTQATGSSTAFLIALLTVLVWGITGPLFHYSDTWQLVINTGTTIITFLMVFLIQKSQNKDSMAMQIKLNELIAVNRKASNRLLNIENMSEDDLRKLSEFFGELVNKAQQDQAFTESHSVEEAHEIHEEKVQEERKEQLDQLPHTN